MEDEDSLLDEAAGLSEGFLESDFESDAESVELEEESVKGEEESPGPDEASLELELLGA